MVKLSTLVNYMIVTVVSLVMLITGILTSTLRYQATQNTHNRNINLLMKRLSSNLAWPLWNYDKRWTENVIHIEMENEFVHLIGVYNEDNKLICGLIKEGARILRDDNGVGMDLQRQKIGSIRSVNLYYNDMEIGKVKVVVTKKYLHRIISKDIWMLIAQLFIMSLILIAILHRILRQIIIRPLQQYCDLVGRFREHNLFIRADFRQNKEMKVLSDTFNAMADTLQNYSEEMTRQVRLRTRQLQASNDELLQIQRQMETELQMGRRIQESIIPEISGFEFDCSGYYRPMEQLGGDYYDIISRGNRKYAFVIADVCGHGVPAAMVTMMAKISFQKNIRLFDTAEDVIHQVNADLCRVTANKEYLAAFYGELDLEAGILTYSNAALTEILLLQNDGMLQRLEPNSAIIGYLEKLPLRTASIPTEKISKIILYTDGITESPYGDDRYGLERLEAVVALKGKGSAQQLRDAIIDDLNTFMPLEYAQDDLTLLVLDLDAQTAMS